MVAKQKRYNSETTLSCWHITLMTAFVIPPVFINKLIITPAIIFVVHIPPFPI